MRVREAGRWESCCPATSVFALSHSRTCLPWQGDHNSTTTRSEGGARSRALDPGAETAEPRLLLREGPKPLVKQGLAHLPAQSSEVM